MNIAGERVKICRALPRVSVDGVCVCVEMIMQLHTSPVTFCLPHVALSLVKLCKVYFWRFTTVGIFFILDSAYSVDTESFLSHRIQAIKLCLSIESDPSALC